MRTETKQRVLDTARNLMRVQGYNATGLNQIIKESGTPKGSLYHYFPGGKEQLASEAIGLAAEEMGHKLHAAFEGAKTLAEALERVIDIGVQELLDSNFECGCPVATVALETSGGAVQETCRTAFLAAQELIEGQLLSKGVEAARAAQLATFLFASYEGALVLSRTQRDVKPLETLKTMIPTILGN